MTRVDTAEKLINALSSDNAIDKLICKDVHITNAVLNFTKAANVVLQHCTFSSCIIQNAQSAHSEQAWLHTKYSTPTESRFSALSPKIATRSPRL